MENFPPTREPINKEMDPAAMATNYDDDDDAPTENRNVTMATESGGKFLNCCFLNNFFQIWLFYIL